MTSVMQIAMREMGQLIELANANQKYLPGPILNVGGFGAVADGSTDCTSIVQSVIDEAIANGQRTIFFPHGKTGQYYVTALTNADQVDFIGDNCSFVGGYSGTITNMGGLAELSADVAYLTAPTRNILTVAKTGGQFTTINDAIDFAKIYCTVINRVTIQIGPGDYEEEIILYPNPGIDIIGSGSTVTRVQFPSEYPNSPIFTMGHGYFSDIGFISASGGNNSYAFHFDSQIDPATGVTVFNNCTFLSYNNAGIGIGTGQDTTIQFNSCDIASIGYTAAYCHNYPDDDISNQLIEFRGCKITSYGFSKCLTVDDAAKLNGKSNSVLYLSLANCQSSQPNITYRLDGSTTLSYIPKTGSDIILAGNSKNTNILGCDVDFSEFTTGGIIAVMSTGIFTLSLPNASKYDYTPYSAVDEAGDDVLSTISFAATADGYAVFTTSAASVKGKTVNINIKATAK